MIKHASWAHGNAMVPELQSGLLVRHWGGGTQIQFTFGLNQTPPAAWCHIPIPTPVIVNDVRLRVQTLFLLFKTGQHAAIDNVHIFDGPNRIHTWDANIGSGGAGRRTGDHSRGTDPVNTLTLPNPHSVMFGMSIAFTFVPVALTTSSPPVDPEGTLLITAAGADFF
jgi:hypothetical protein